MDAVAFLLDDNVDADWLLEVVSVIVHEALGFEPAVLPFREGLAQPCFRYFEQALETGEHLFLSILCRELVQAPLAKAIGAKLPPDIAKHQLGRAAVGANDAIDITNRFEAALIAHRGEVQTFVESLARLPGAASWHRSADVALVGNRTAESDQRAPGDPPAARAHGGPLRAAALVGMIDQERVALRDGVAELRDDRAAAGR